MKQMNPYHHQKSISEADTFSSHKSPLKPLETIESSTWVSARADGQTSGDEHLLKRSFMSPIEKNESIFKSAASKLLSPSITDKVK